ncbi:MAG: hypothetical protein WC674_00765 [Candidatus Krumholzibacteriia bacterium]
MFKGKVVAFALMLVFATSVYAGDVDDCRSTAGTDDGLGTLAAVGLKITVCPAGDFEFIRNAAGGSTAYIWIIARDAGGNPIPGIPWTDYWLNACNPAKQLALCSTPVTADSLTGANGKTTFSNRLSVGGCTLTGGIWWAIQGKPLKGVYPSCISNVCLDIIVKSPDLTGAGGLPDGIINLSDMVPFGTSYNKNLGQAGYNACCDYTDDDKCNLSDFAYFGTHKEHRC